MNRLQREIERAVLSVGILAATMVGSMPPVGAATPDEAELHATSTIGGLKFTVLNILPQAPKIIGRDICNCVTNPASEGGKQVKAHGWPITAEVSMGHFEAVSFAAHFVAAYGGPYVTQQGNVAIFDGPRLIALVYGAKASDPAVGFVEALEGGGVRVWDGGSPNNPVADIQADGTALRLGPIAVEQSFCQGKAIVPNIYGMPVDKARALLQAKGWSPVPAKLGSNETQFSREIALAKRGVIEASNCSGTGLGYCSFGYTGAAGTLGVTTIGDDDFPSVSDYSVTCR